MTGIKPAKHGRDHGPNGADPIPDSEVVPAARTLYACEGDATTNGKLYTISPAAIASPVNVGSTGYSVQAIAADPTTGILYGVTSAAGSNTKSLITINKTTGVGTVVGSTGLAVVLDDIEFDPAGQLYGLHQKLYTIDKSTGTATDLGGTSMAAGAHNGAFAYRGYDTASPFFVMPNGGSNNSGHVYKLSTAGIRGSIYSDLFGSDFGSSDGIAGASYREDGVLWAVKYNGASNKRLVVIVPIPGYSNTEISMGAPGTTITGICWA